MSRPSQINWHKEQTLNADDLLAWENFVFSRWQIESILSCGGLEMIDREHSIKGTLDETGENLILHACDIIGATDAGLPIRVVNNSLVTKVRIDNGIECHLMLSIRTNERRARVSDPIPNKLTLHADIAEADSTPVQGEGEMSLGMFRWSRAAPATLVMVSIPRVRRFECVQWHPAVSGLQSAIDDLLARVQKTAPSQPRQLLLFGEAARLSFSWPSLPVPLFLRKCHLIRWLQQDPQGLLFPPDLHALCIEEQSFARRPPTEWPDYLASLVRPLGPDDRWLPVGAGAERTPHGYSFRFIATFQTRHFNVRISVHPSYSSPDAVQVIAPAGTTYGIRRDMSDGAQHGYDFFSPERPPHCGDVWEVRPLPIESDPMLYYRSE